MNGTEHRTHVTAVVLAAGKGTRMGSELPKVLHELGGDPLVFRPIRAALAGGADDVVVVVGHGEARVRAVLDAEFDALRFARQENPRGTGHAVQSALPAIPVLGPEIDHRVVVLSGDVPGLEVGTLRQLIDACADGLSLGVFEVDEPTGYGRIVRDDDGEVRAIVEERDASAEQRRIRECNGGVYCFRVGPMRRHLVGLDAANAQGELYLTDLVAAFATERLPITAVPVPALELAGVNTPEQLAALEAALAEASDALRP